MPLVLVGNNLFLVVKASLESGRSESVSHVIPALLYGEMMLPAAFTSPPTLLLVIILIIVHASPGHHRARPAVNCTAVTLASPRVMHGGGGGGWWLRTQLYPLPSGS